MNNIQLKQAFKTIDEIIQEVHMAEETSLDIICSKLQEENSRFKSPVVTKIISILRQWGKIPANEIQNEARNL
jgi:hypothetical protein